MLPESQREHALLRSESQICHLQTGSHVRTGTHCCCFKGPGLRVDFVWLCFVSFVLFLSVTRGTSCVPGVKTQQVLV